MNYLIQARDFVSGWYWWVGDNEGNGTFPLFRYRTLDEAEQVAMLLALRQSDPSIRYFVKEENDATCYD